LDRIAAAGVAMELNTSGVNKTVSQMNPFPGMLREMRERDIPVTIGADAHQPDRVADGYETALQLLADCGYTKVSFYLSRRRQEVSIEDALASLVSSSVA
jgi:histidinol-phosphatase (PHP family)